MKKILLLLTILFLLFSCEKEHVTSQRRTFDARSFGQELYILALDQSKSFQPKKIEVNEIETLIKTLEAKRESFDLSIYFIKSPNDERIIHYRYSPPTIKKGNDLETRRINAKSKRKFNSEIATKRTRFLNDFKQVNDLPRSQYTDLESMRNFLLTRVREPRYRKCKVNIFAYTDGKHSIPNSNKRSIPPIEFDRGNILTFTSGMPRSKQLFKREETKLINIQSFIDNLNM